MEKIKNTLKDRFLVNGFSKTIVLGKSQKYQKPKILLEIYLEEEKRERQIEEIWNSLTDEDFEYIKSESFCFKDFKYLKMEKFDINLYNNFIIEMKKEGKIPLKIYIGEKLIELPFESLDRPRLKGHYRSLKDIEAGKENYDRYEEEMKQYKKNLRIFYLIKSYYKYEYGKNKGIV